MAMTIRPAAPLDPEAVLPMALVRLHLKIDADDARAPLALAWRTAALAWVEKHSGYSLQRREWIATFDDLSGGLRLPMGPVASVTSLSYAADAITPQVWPAVSYRLKGDDVITVSGLPMRSAFAGLQVSVEYLAGFVSLADDAPHLQASAMLLLLHLWAGGSLDDVPATIAMVCDLDRVPVIG
jgi:uncharacterized phiE125 gp8 family phage protein